MNYFNTQRYTLTGKMERKCAATVMSHGHSVESAVLKKKVIFLILCSARSVCCLSSTTTTHNKYMMGCI